MPTSEPGSTSAAGGPSQGLHIVWWKRLGVRATAVFALVTLASVTLFVVVTLRAQQRYLTSEVLRGAVQFSDTIKASTYHFMLADERVGAYRTMEAIGRLQGIEKVRMLNKEGRVTYSTESREVGQLVDKRAEACYACHAAGQPLVRLNVPSRSRIFQHNGHRVLAMITPIYNEAGCSASDCHAHPEEQQVLGVVDVAMSLAREDAAIESLGRSTLLFGGLAVMTAAVLGGAAWLAATGRVSPTLSLSLTPSNVPNFVSAAPSIFSSR